MLFDWDFPMNEQPIPPPPLGIVLFSGEYERAHYALVLATSAAAIDRRVVLFATNGGIRAFLKPRADGSPGWAALGHPDGALVRDAELRARGVAGFAELREAAVDLRVQLIVCEAGLRSIGLTAADLDPALPGEVAGAVSFLRAAEGGQTLFI